MSPILVRPVREQLEHDRVIRLLQGKHRRKFDTAINPGAERNVAVGSGVSAVYPDLVLTSPDRGRRVEAVIEVETGESVNHLEALAQWVHLSRLKAAFHLYVPSTMIEVARRLCEDNQIVAAEMWSYNGIGDDIRFALVHRTRSLPEPSSSKRPVVTPSAKSGALKPASKSPQSSARTPAKPPAGSKASTAKARAAKPETSKSKSKSAARSVKAKPRPASSKSKPAVKNSAPKKRR